MSLSRLLAGRKRDSPVWDFFNFDEATGKSTCQVGLETGRNNGICGTALAGKNTSNMVAHLRLHKEVHLTYLEKERKMAEVKQGVKRKSSNAQMLQPHRPLLKECFQFAEF